METKATSSPAQILDILRDNLEGCFHSTPLIMSILASQRFKAGGDFNSWLGKHAETISHEGQTYYSIPPVYTHRTETLKRKVERAKNASKILPRTVLISFVSIFDSFIYGLIRSFLILKPEILNCEQKQIPLSELKNFSNFNEIREHILEQEIEEMMRGSHSDHIQWIEKIFNIDLKSIINSWEKFIEITERRNLYVHSDGIVNKQYMSICKKNEVDLQETQLGTELEVSRAYLKESLDCLLETSVAIQQALWRKIFPKNENQLEEADKSLINITYSLILNGEYLLAQKVLLNAQKNIRKYRSEANRLTNIINLAQTYYHLGDKDSCIEILEKIDWSACQDKYKLCYCVLTENYDEASGIMKKIGNPEDLDINYNEWPIFKNFRENDLFFSTYKSIFGKDPNHLEIPEEAQLERKNWNKMLSFIEEK
ncbi:MAG TPA: hypothetical protein PLK94_01195 [Alphaproteobacteria bacterium]|nr:hypothetical protein [Alphaproteobacteria bacterium]HOO49883.1 hypothetical protein [Alphaproteobacteria bacterium]